MWNNVFEAIRNASIANARIMLHVAFTFDALKIQKLKIRKRNQEETWENTRKRSKFGIPFYLLSLYQSAPIYRMMFAIGKDFHWNVNHWNTKLENGKCFNAINLSMKSFKRKQSNPTQATNHTKKQRKTDIEKKNPISFARYILWLRPNLLLHSFALCAKCTAWNRCFGSTNFFLIQ